MLQKDCGIPFAIEVILLRRPFEQKGIPHIEEDAGARLGISQVFLLLVSKAFLVDPCDFCIHAV